MKVVIFFGGKLTYINDFLGKGKGGGEYQFYSLVHVQCSLLALLCGGSEQEHAGATLEHLSVNYFLITEQLWVGWIGIWYWQLVVGSPHYLLSVWLNQEEGREEGITNLVCRPFKVFITCTGTFFGLCEAWEQLWFGWIGIWYWQLVVGSPHFLQLVWATNNTHCLVSVHFNLCTE